MMLDWKAYPHFSEAEFRCPCGCGRAEMNPRFLARLESARALAGVAFRINSGFRCPEHNAAVSKESTGRHCKGEAADIAAPGAGVRGVVLAALFRAGFNSVAIGPSFIHVDEGAPWCGLY
jgi:uncharacterized protein YcbK (DUF882 family)